MSEKKRLTIEEAERITAWYRRWFTEPGDTDLKLVSRCHKAMTGGAYSLAFLALFAPVAFRRDGPATVIIWGVGTFALAMFFVVCARQLERVRDLFDTYGPQNISELSQAHPDDRNA